MLHQSWIWGIYCTQATKHASEGIHPVFETQSRYRQKCPPKNFFKSGTGTQLNGGLHKTGAARRRGRREKETERTINALLRWNLCDLMRSKIIVLSLYLVCLIQVLCFNDRNSPWDDDGMVNWVFQWLWQTVSAEQLHWFLDNLGSSSAAELRLFKSHTSQLNYFRNLFLVARVLGHFVCLIYDLKALDHRFRSFFIHNFGNTWLCSWHEFTQVSRISNIGAGVGGWREVTTRVAKSYYSARLFQQLEAK